MADAYEQKRLQALAERQVAEFAGPDHRSLAVRYGPGSFGFHEAMHVTQVVVDLIERELLSHSAVLLDEFWDGKAREAQALLRSTYTHVVEAHLAAPLPAGEPADDGSRH
ncbi:hypothetical protein LCGC14_0806290 [marine sediment metagenome]|uniref:Uncharacterized protein n=1 Tax=marine sediment metagenome TaxID=412755 RepID=A0A0F9PSL4_9ZZZZ